MEQKITRDEDFMEEMKRCANRLFIAWKLGKKHTYTTSITISADLLTFIILGLVKNKELNIRDDDVVHSRFLTKMLWEFIDQMENIPDEFKCEAFISSSSFNDDKSLVISDFQFYTKKNRKTFADDSLYYHCDNDTCKKQNKLTDLKKCSICKSARYCCRECQVEDWKEHKKECEHKKKCAELLAEK